MQLFLINKNNQILDLLNTRNKFILTKADALHGIETEIGESESPYTDGVEIDTVKALPRGIELVLKLRGNVKESIDYITSIVKSKQFVTLREIDGERDITIKGVVTIPPYTRMLRSCEISISIYCGQPYWEDLNYIVGVISEKIDLLCFPQEGQYFPVSGRPFGVIKNDLITTLVNESDVAVGMVISLLALGEVTNPRISCSTGEQNGWYMQLNLTLQPNDLVEISTVKNNKYITINGLELYNGDPILNHLEFKGNDWLQLEQGSNTFNVTASTGESSIYVNLIYKGRYE